MAYKLAGLLLLSLLSVSFAQTGKDCFNSIVATKRADSSWISGPYGYQVYDIIITNQSPSNCQATSCTPELNFIECDILSHWNWNATCTNCATATQTERTYSAPAVFWENLLPAQQYNAAGFIVKYDVSKASDYAVTNGQPQSCACLISSQFPTCDTNYA